MGAFTALAGDLVIHPDSSAWLKKARSRSSFFDDAKGASFHDARNSRSRSASSSRRNRTPYTGAEFGQGRGPVPLRFTGRSQQHAVLFQRWSSPGPRRGLRGELQDGVAEEVPRVV